MVFLGWPECICRLNFRHRSCHLALLFFRYFLLLLCVIVDARSVLGAHVVPLRVQLRRVVSAIEHVTELLEAHDFRVVSHLDGLGVARHTAADHFIRGVVHLSLDITHGRLLYAINALEPQLDTPEATGCEGRERESVVLRRPTAHLRRVRFPAKTEETHGPSSQGTRRKRLCTTRRTRETNQVVSGFAPDLRSDARRRRRRRCSSS
mmetsp:Transcript_3216/g.9521  ORF Transcript_3216/g.9521 Transcript_3216/m.9521 type:complete len:207 (+) Transcript_3216:193-813(+)